MRALVVAALVAFAGCASTRALAPAAPCPTVAASWTPRERPWAPTVDPRYPCLRWWPTPGADGLRDGRDLDEGLYCVYRYYQGPDGLPIDAMLKGALDALVRAYPIARHAAVSAILDDVHDIDSLTRTLLRVAALTRMAIGFWAKPPPEDVLLQGALSALAWPAEFRHPPFGHVHDDSYTAIGKDHVGYVKAGAFVKGVAVRFRRELMKHRLSGVILDLRGSSGGLFREAIELADLFTSSGCLVTTRPPIRHASARDQLYDVEAPLVILVDHKTVSAAELVAATLRARDRAVLIGDGTAGEALLQTVYSLSSGALLKLTNGEMLAGDGTPIHGRGVEPDVALPVSFEPDNGPDRAIDFAKQVLRGTRGGARSDLLATAHELAAAATR